jgi:hypothetical protein
MDVLKWSEGQPIDEDVRFVNPSQAEEEENCLALHHFVQARALAFRIPETMKGGEQFHRICATASAFSRVPVGGQGLSAKPSLID